MKKFNLLLVPAFLFFAGISQYVKAQNNCISGCNQNTFVNAVNPNTIEYDNMVSVFHSSMVKEYNGAVKVWGQGIAHNGNGQTNNVLSPQLLNSTNYPRLTGNVLKFTGASSQNTQQFAVLTTTGLFVWGNINTLIPQVNNTSGTLITAGVFNKIAVGTITSVSATGTATATGLKSDGLPDGVSPSNVKMMFGTRMGLVIVTCTGAAYILTDVAGLYADGATSSTANNRLWHRVNTALNTPLTNVIAVRGTYQTMMALTSDGNIYTWGIGTRLGDGTTEATRNYATLMTKPAGVTPKMVGMTLSFNGKSYYLLATDGKLYSMGENEGRQLGIGSTTDSDVWAQVTASRTVSGTTYTIADNVAWVSPQEHDGYNSTSSVSDAVYAAVNIITDGGKLWAWGTNNTGMITGNAALGTSYSTANTAVFDPILMPGSISPSAAYNSLKLNLSDNIIAVETGGHTSLNIKQCTTKFGYVGHRINGSMANGSDANTTETSYNYSDTAVLYICGALAAPAVTNLAICPGTTANLANAEPSSLPSGATGINWWTDQAATVAVPNTASVGVGTYYATYEGSEGLVVRCPSSMTVSIYPLGSVEYSNCIGCYEPPYTPGTGPTTQVGITLLKRAGNDTVGNNWPMARRSGHIALESNTRGFVITRMTTAQINAITNPIEGMMVYDTNLKCLKIYDGTAWGCFSNSACP